MKEGDDKGTPKKAQGKIDPAIAITLKRLQDDGIMELDPYGMKGPYSEAEGENHEEVQEASEPEEAAGAVALAKGPDKTAPRSGRRKAAGAAVDARRCVVHFSAARKAELDLLLLCYRIETQEKISLSEFIYRHLMKGLEAERPKVLDMFRRYGKKLK